MTSRWRPVLWSFVLSLYYFVLVSGQYRNDTPQYQQTLAEEVLTLKDEIRTHPDVEFYFNPESALLEKNNYVFDFPLSAKYRIGIIIDPCRFNRYNCCVNVFGTPEYPALLQSGLEAERAFKYDVIADENEVASNYFLIDEDSGSIATSAQRAADDSAVFNLSCVSDGNPTTFCSGRNYAYTRSALRPPCVDNNTTLNVLDGCYATNGTKYQRCVQIAYTSNAFIPQCGSDAGEHCGTFLEIHMAHGTPYQDESTIISQVRVSERNVSGYYSTMIPTTWMNNQSKVLCSYSESVLRIGTLVYIKDSAPVCCCPPPFSADTRVGSFQCPVGPTANGAFAYRSQTIADTINVDTLLLDYPFCPIDLSYNVDRMMCSAYDVDDRRHYTRNCTAVRKMDSRSRSWTSIDLQGEYDGLCGYYSSCGLTEDLGKCRRSDLRFTFRGRVGLVTALNDAAEIPTVWVSFNEGRTSYEFNQEHVKLETTPKSMYEIWWVVRSPSEFTVQKRKGFNVTEPSCTFDTTHNRYYPYAILQSNGKPLDNSQIP